MRSLVATTALLFLGAGDQIAPTLRTGMPTHNDTALAVAAVPRFGADRFPSLPPTVRQEFVAMNCQVPQPSLTAGPSNMIEGEFAAKGQRDWAALCSDGSASTIRIVWGGDSRCESSLAAQQDSDVLTSTAPGKATFSRALSVAAIEQIYRYLVRRSDVLLGEVPSHDAIEDRSGPSGLAYYCRDGHWVTIPGE
jgi:hypothetical protein